MHDSNSTIQDFLSAAAARQPTPGGGAVAALVGALAAAMGEMSIQYSLGRKAKDGASAELTPALAELGRARAVLLELMIEDQAAYAALVEARKLPAETPERQARIDAALVAAISVPQAVAATGLAVLGLCDQILNFVNPQLLSDLAICADLAMAGLRCGLYNVRVNLPAVADHDQRVRIESQVNQLLSRATELIQQVSPRIWAKHGQAT